MLEINSTIIQPSFRQLMELSLAIYLINTPQFKSEISNTIVALNLEHFLSNGVLWTYGQKTFEMV
jgi:hypothetical protein